MRAKIELDNVQSLKVKRILLADEITAVYELTFFSDDVEVTAVVTQELLNYLHTETLNYQPGMPGFQGMLD